MFNEHHPELADIKPDTSMSPSPRALTPIRALPEVDTLIGIGRTALERVKSSPAQFIAKCEGCMYVTVHESRNLLNKEIFGKMVTRLSRLDCAP